MLNMEKEQLFLLVTRAQKGDSAAMDELFAAFYNDVYYFALKTVKDSDLACDITQEAFLEIINTIGDLLSEEHPEQVIDLLLQEQKKALHAEIAQRQEMLERLEGLQKGLKSVEQFSVESIGDIAYRMENKKKLNKSFC